MVKLCKYYVTKVDSPVKSSKKDKKSVAKDLICVLYLMGALRVHYKWALS